MAIQHPRWKSTVTTKMGFNSFESEESDEAGGSLDGGPEPREGERDNLEGPFMDAGGRDEERSPRDDGTGHDEQCGVVVRCAHDEPPSDAPSGTEPLVVQPSGAKPSGAKPSGAKPSGPKPSGAKPSGAGPLGFCEFVESLPPERQREACSSNVVFRRVQAEFLKANPSARRARRQLGVRRRRLGETIRHQLMLGRQFAAWRATPKGKASKSFRLKYMWGNNIRVRKAAVMLLGHDLFIDASTKRESTTMSRGQNVRERWTSLAHLP